MEPYIPISFLNDFIFCPRSIYFHQLYGQFNTIFYNQKSQEEGINAHSSIDEKHYSSKTTILQSFEVFSEKYNLCGKIDVFDIEKGKLIERKKRITVIYDGYVFQVYAHCHALREMGYEVKEIIIHDLDHNKNYKIPLPENDSEMQSKFENLISEINDFNLFEKTFIPLLSKCQSCIYNQLCDYSLC